ncbi:aminoglycoside phosphotransferase family protein [bacterium]|nr:MAG: aminoglycoside phosphotransferase family protein [bacterium]QQR62277.1 MAG: aminoglycoside phosphotransferase family protein [bacterium]QQR63158.1 MAG: aminoglycoside phosphotransferase family protein [bacterium]
MNAVLNPTVELARKLILKQFPEFSHLPVSNIEKQGHDNRTFRLGSELLIRMPIAEDYALKVPKEQELLPQLAKYLSVNIPVPIKMGKPSTDYPYPFSICKWLPGKSINLLTLTEQEKEQLAYDVAQFLKKLQTIKGLKELLPGQHNWWRGDHVSVYDQGARKQIQELAGIIDVNQALELWNQACATKWNNAPVWIHGDVAIGNLLMDDGKLSAVIDFGGAAIGDPACDLVIAWTYFSRKSRQIFMSEMNMDSDTWLRARAWVLWKATYELCQIAEKNSSAAQIQKKIIEDVMN